jgi:hypothetical protein
MTKFLEDALASLAPNVRWRITGEPVYENIVWIDTPNQIPTKEVVEAKAKELLDAYNAEEYARSRANEYPSFADQFDLLYHGGYDAWKATIKAVKDKYPKD